MAVWFNNTSTPLDYAECISDVPDSSGWKTFKAVLFSSIMIIASIGNMTIISIVYRKRKMRQTTNMFIANMALSDALLAIVAVPRLLTQLYIGNSLWLADGFVGAFTCKLVFFLEDISIFISIGSHTVIAIDRFWAIVFSLRPSIITHKRRMYIIAVIWVLACTLHSPNLYKYRTRTTSSGVTFCFNNWAPLDHARAQKIYFGVILVVVVTIPVTVMVVLYTSLIVAFIVQSATVSTATSHQSRSRRRREDIRVVRKVIIILVVFLISLLPLTILAVQISYVWDFKLPCAQRGFVFVASTLYLSNSAVNPCLCIALNESYTNYIRDTLCYWIDRLPGKQCAGTLPRRNNFLSPFSGTRQRSKETSV